MVSTKTARDYWLLHNLGGFLYCIPHKGRGGGDSCGKPPFQSCLVLSTLALQPLFGETPSANRKSYSRKKCRVRNRKSANCHICGRSTILDISKKNYVRKICGFAICGICLAVCLPIFLPVCFLSVCCTFACLFACLFAYLCLLVWLFAYLMAYKEASILKTRWSMDDKAFD
jgi:hypothetical protein